MTLHPTPILDLGETADALGVTRERVRQFVFAELLKPCAQQGRFLFLASDVDLARERLASIELELDAAREALA